VHHRLRCWSSGQLRIAAGEPLANWLSNGQADVRFTGHAIEARLYAEDPYDGFKPRTGRILALAARRDGAYATTASRRAARCTPWYDAMVAKLDRARPRPRRCDPPACAQPSTRHPWIGVTNNGRFLRDLLQHEDFGRRALDHHAAGRMGGRSGTVDAAAGSE